MDSVALTRNGARAAIVTSFVDQSSVPTRPGHFLTLIATAGGGVEKHSSRIEVPEDYPVPAVSFSPDGGALLVGDQIIDAASGRKFAGLAADTAVPPFAAQYAPDGRLIFALYDAGLAHSTTLRIYSAKDGLLLQTFLTPVSLSLQFSADGKAFAIQDFGGLGVHLTPDPDEIAARVRRLLDSAALLPAP